MRPKAMTPPSTPNLALRVLPSESALFDALAEHVIALAARAHGEGQPFTLALAGGSTPRALYAALARPEQRARVAWQNVVAAFGDERCVPPSDPESNERMARESLLDGVPARVLRVPTELPPGEAAQRYELSLRALFHAPIGPPRRTFDLALLGLGADGHTASLFPHAAALVDEHAWAVAVPAPAAGPMRVSLTLPVLAAAGELAVLVSGAEKRVALHGSLYGPFDPARWPLQALAARGARVTVWADPSAAGM